MTTNPTYEEKLDETINNLKQIYVFFGRMQIQDCIIANQVSKRAIQDLKQLKEGQNEVITYEQGFERGKQVGYKEGWRARSEYTTEERVIVEIKKNFIDELIEQCYPYDERNHNSVIGEDRLKEIRKSLD